MLLPAWELTGMATGDFVAYYRVSTQRQGRSGLGLDAQREAVRGYLNGGRWHLVAEVTEIESGKRSDRPQLGEALRLCRRHRATLVIAKLDRLARNVAFTSNLMESGVEFTAVDFPQANRLTVHILAAVAEHEAKAISDRTRAALAQARARGVVLGGDRGNLAAVSETGRRLSATRRIALADAHAADIRPDVEAIRANGVVSLNGIARELNQRGVPAARAGAWTATGVRRLLARIDLSN